MLLPPQGYKERNAFILTEAPMESTLPVLWKMIYEKECRTIVVLYGLKESAEVRENNHSYDDDNDHILD